MRWLVCFALALSLLPGLCSAQSWSSSSTESPSAVSGDSSSGQLPSWEKLDELLSSLESAALDSSRDSAKLRQSLETARLKLIELSKSLDESRTQASELSALLEQCETSLRLSEKSLKEAQALARRRDTELWIWRAAAVLGLAAGAFGLGYGLSK